MSDAARRGWWACGALLVLLAVALSVNASSDPDLGFHVATGRAVLVEGAIPRVNVLSFAEPDQPWINQQWLPATLFAIAFDHAGFAGTLAIRVLLVALTTALLVLTARRLGASVAWTACLVGLGTWAAALRFVERPLLFSNLALALVLFACASAAATRDRRFVLLACVTASVAIHLHAGAIFSLLALSVSAVACVLEPMAARWVGREPLAHARDGAVLAGGAVLAVALAAITLALYHPYGIAVLGVPLRMASDAYLQEHLVEFRPPFDQPLRLMAPYWAFVVVAFGIAVASARRAPLPLFAVVALGLAISLRHARFVDLAWILGAPALAALATRRWAAVSSRTLLGTALAIGVGALIDRTSLAPPAIGGAPAIWPDTTFDVIAREHLVGPTFVQDGWAGPFLARFWPRERVFFHPAFEAYSEGHYRLYQRVRYGEPGWRETLDRFGVETVVMRYTSERERALQEGRPNLRQRLAADDAWALVDVDDLGEIFVRRAGANAEAATGAPSGVDPDRLSFVGAPRAARAGLERLATGGDVSDRLALLLAVARADDGDAAGADVMLSSIRTPALAEIGRHAIARLGAR